MRRFIRVQLVDKPDRTEVITLPLMLDKNERLVRNVQKGGLDEWYFGYLFQNTHDQGQGDLYPLILKPSGEIEFGAGAKSADNPRRTDLYDQQIRRGQIIEMTFPGWGHDRYDYLIEEVVQLVP